MTTGRQVRAARCNVWLKKLEANTFSRTPLGELAGCAGVCTACCQRNSCTLGVEYQRLVTKLVRLRRGLK